MSTNPDELVALGTYPNEFVAGVMRAKLEDAGIPARSITANQALIGAFGQSGWLPFTVWVRAGDEARAHAVLAAVRDEQGTVDWDAVDVGDPDANDGLAQRIASGRGEDRRVRLGIAGALLIGAVIFWEISGVVGNGMPYLGGLIGMTGMVMLVAASAIGVRAMMRRRAPAE